MGLLSRLLANSTAKRLHAAYFEEADRLRRLSGSQRITIDAHLVVHFHTLSWGQALHKARAPWIGADPLGFPAIPYLQALAVSCGVPIEAISAELEQRAEYESSRRLHREEDS